MEWVAVLRDIILDLLIAGAIGAWVPDSFWQHFFLTDHPLLAKIWGPLVGPLIAVVSFVCSIGNVPLAAVLWNSGISFGGVMTFIFAYRPIRIQSSRARRSRRRVQQPATESVGVENTRGGVRRGPQSGRIQISGALIARIRPHIPHGDRKKRYRHGKRGRPGWTPHKHDRNHARGDIHAR